MIPCHRLFEQCHAKLQLESISLVLYFVFYFYIFFFLSPPLLPFSVSISLPLFLSSSYYFCCYWINNRQRRHFSSFMNLLTGFLLDWIGSSNIQTPGSSRAKDGAGMPALITHHGTARKSWILDQVESELLSQLITVRLWQPLVIHPHIHWDPSGASATSTPSAHVDSEGILFICSALARSCRYHGDQGSWACHRSICSPPANFFFSFFFLFRCRITILIYHFSCIDFLLLLLLLRFDWIEILCTTDDRSLHSTL